MPCSPFIKIHHFPVDGDLCSLHPVASLIYWIRAYKNSFPTHSVQTTWKYKAWALLHSFSVLPFLPLGLFVCCLLNGKLTGIGTLPSYLTVKYLTCCQCNTNNRLDASPFALLWPGSTKDTETWFNQPVRKTPWIGTPGGHSQLHATPSCSQVLQA